MRNLARARIMRAMVSQTDKHPAQTPPENRLKRLGHGIDRQPDAPRELQRKHKLLVDYQINGCQHRDLLQRIKRVVPATDEGGLPVLREVSPEPGDPLTLIEAADLLRIRRRNAREIAATPAYATFLNSELKRYREGEKVASLHTIVDIRDDPGLGKAADRKVRLTAAQMLLGEAGGQGTTVNVNLPGSQQMVAGIVIDLSDDDEVERDRPSALTIDHED